MIVKKGNNKKRDKKENNYECKIKGRIKNRSSSKI